MACTQIGEWLESLDDPDHCMWCGRRFDNLPHKREVQHIERRAFCRDKERRDHPCNLLIVGASCHSGPLANAPHAHQLAVKLCRDPKHFDLFEWMSIRDPDLMAPFRVTLEDIAQHLELRR